MRKSWPVQWWPPYLGEGLLQRRRLTWKCHRMPLDLNEKICRKQTWEHSWEQVDQEPEVQGKTALAITIHTLRDINPALTPRSPRAVNWGTDDRAIAGLGRLSFTILSIIFWRRITIKKIQFASKLISLSQTSYFRVIWRRNLSLRNRNDDNLWLLWMSLDVMNARSGRYGPFGQWFTSDHQFQENYSSFIWKKSSLNSNRIWNIRNES